MSIEEKLELIEESPVKEKFRFLVKAVADLLDWYNDADLEEGAQLVLGLKSSFPWDSVRLANAEKLKSRLKSVLTSAAGQVSGYHKELALATRQLAKSEFHGSGKTRQIHFGNRGDVAVDYGLGFGKAIQSKSSFAADKASIDEMIRVAANQLTGERSERETPLPKDRRVVDVTIKNSSNPWPETALLGPTTLEKVRSRIDHLVRDYKSHEARSRGKGYVGFFSLDNELETLVDPRISKLPRSRISSHNRVGIDFVVKIRWDTPRAIRINDATKSVRQVTTRTQVRYLPGKTWWDGYLRTMTDVLLWKPG